MKKLIVKTVISVVSSLNLYQPVFAMENIANKYHGTGAVTQGLAHVVKENLFSCNNGYSRVAGVGEIKDSNGHTWTVPAVNHFTTATKATDLYEQCSGITPRDLNEVDLNTVPAVTIDPEGEVITGYIFADNYFELYINGQLIAVDSVPFTPFNSSVIKFKVNKPYTIAVKVIDWEENLGVGSEGNRGNQYHPGDGGFIASFSDGTVTSNKWQAQTVYTAPIFDLSCLTEKEGARLSSNCTNTENKSGDNAYGIHWPIADGWMTNRFNASHWPYATTFTEDEIGVKNKPAYMNFRDKFAGAGADFIWSTNVVLDNEVLLKYTVK